MRRTRHLLPLCYLLLSCCPDHLLVFSVASLSIIAMRRGGEKDGSFLHFGFFRSWPSLPPSDPVLNLQRQSHNREEGRGGEAQQVGQEKESRERSFGSAPQVQASAAVPLKVTTAPLQITTAPLKVFYTAPLQVSDTARAKQTQPQR